MIIECPQCTDQRSVAEPLPPHRQYHCQVCGNELILIRDDNELSDSADKARPLSKRTTIPKIILTALILLALITSSGGPSILARQGRNLTDSLGDIYQSFIGVSTDKAASMEEVREIIALYEGSIVSEALQAMRPTEKLLIVPRVITPTNDMPLFPSADHPLFSDYLSSRFSQFSYTVDSSGVVSVDSSRAGKDIPLGDIEQLLRPASR